MIDRQNFTCESKVQKKAQTKQENKKHSVPYNRVAGSILEITTRAWLTPQVNFSKKNNSGRDKRKNKNVSAEIK